MEPTNAISDFLLLQKQLIDLYHGVIDRAAADCGLSRPEADVLLFLHNNPQYNTARDVAEYRGVSRAYVSRAVELLLGRGLLRVEVHPTDRRYQLLGLTG
ncbi:MAG: helix-turn-helix domain-containing protein, partial [Oscillospiraceae bacterium]